MKSKFIQPCLLIILFLFVNGCNNFEGKSILEELAKTISNDTISINEAKSYFEDKIRKGEKSKEIFNAEKINRNIFWDLATVSTFSNKQEVVIVPISFAPQTKIIKNNNFHHLWIYRNRQGDMTYRVVEYIFNYEKYENTRSAPNINDFTGVAIFKDWENEFLFGYEFTHSKVVGKISMPSNSKNRIGAVICESTENCRWASVGHAGDPDRPWYLICDTETNCYWGDVDVDMPEEGNGGGGGTIPSIPPYAPPTNPKFQFEMRPDLCSGLSKMWLRQASEGNEMLGLYLSDGRFLIVPSKDNTFTSAPLSYSSAYIDHLGQPVMTVFESYGNWYVELYQGYSYPYPIVSINATYHTHPLTAPGYTPGISLDDQGFASTFSSLNHFAQTDAGLLQFNSTGQIGSNPRSCY